jgi:DNA-binding MarR family transcriptional regulator
MSSSKHPRSEGELAAEGCLRAYQDAVSWRRRVKRELAPVRLTLTQWLVMRTIGSLIRETGDAVSELAVAERSGVDEETVSQVAWRLAYRGHVDIGPSAIWPGLRLLLTTDGERMLHEGTLRIQAASVAWLAERALRAA